MSSRKRVRASMVVVANLTCLLLCGCGGDDIGTIHSVRGRVLHNSEPLTVKTGYVLLMPDVSKGNRTEFEPTGTIDADGSYVIYTKQHSGAPPGWYKVIVTASGEPTTPPQNQSTTRPLPKSLVPPRYGQESTTPLTIEVVADPADGAYDLDVAD